jgi:hypothetical protein
MTLLQPQSGRISLAKSPKRWGRTGLARHRAASPRPGTCLSGRGRGTLQMLGLVLVSVNIPLKSEPPAYFPGF